VDFKPNSISQNQFIHIYILWIGLISGERESSNVMEKQQVITLSCCRF